MGKSEEQTLFEIAKERAKVDVFLQGLGYTNIANMTIEKRIELDAQKLVLQERKQLIDKKYQGQLRKVCGS